MENAFTAAGTFKSQKELKKLMIDQIQKENRLIAERVNQLQQGRISQALSDLGCHRKKTLMFSRWKMKLIF